MLVTVTPPTDYPVTLEEAKAQVGLDNHDSAFDALLVGLIAGATASAQEYTGARFMSQVVKLQLECFPAYDRRIDLGVYPVATVDAVTYTDEAGTVQPLEAGGVDFWASVAGGQLYPWLGPSDHWPDTLPGKPDAVEITMTVGFASADAVPADIKTAILLRVGELFDRRGETHAGEIVTPNVNTMQLLLGPHRRMRAA